MEELHQLREELKALNDRLWAIMKGESSATPAEQSDLARKKREIKERLGKLEKRAHKGR